MLKLLFNLLLNLVTLGWWERHLGEQNSGAHLTHISSKDVTFTKGRREGTNFKDR